MFYFDVLHDIVNKYNNTVHRTIKMKSIDITNDYYVKYDENQSLGTNFLMLDWYKPI